MKQVSLKLYGEQTNILNDWVNTDKHSICIVPAGSGKTFLASIFLPIAASDKKYHKGKDILYVAPTREMIRTLIWEPLKKSCKEYFGLTDNHIHNGDLTIEFSNGTFLRCKSAEQKENLRGINAGIIVMDEASLYSQESLLELTNRLRPKVGEPDSAGRMIIISTPNGAGPLYDLYKAAVNMPEKFMVRHYNYEQMRSGNLEFIMEQKKILSPLKFQQDYMCSFESVTDQFYYTWNKHKYCVDEIVDNGRDLYSFHDFNKRVMCATVCQVINPGKPDGRIEVLKSYAINDCGTEGIAERIRADFPRRRINSVIDMSGTQVNRDTTSPFGITDRIILEKFGFTIVNNRNSNPLISDTDNTSNSFINRGGLVVHKDDAKLLEALGTYHFEDGTRKKLVKYTEQAYAHIDGLGDCIRYGIHHLFPITHVNDGPDYITSDPRMNRRPGVEHLPYSPLYPGGPSWEELINENVNGSEDYVTY